MFTARPNVHRTYLRSFHSHPNIRMSFFFPYYINISLKHALKVRKGPGSGINTGGANIELKECSTDLAFNIYIYINK